MADFYILVADDGQYLGTVTCNTFDSDSIFNQFGDYGSQFSTTSIWNQFGTYGGNFGRYSPFNQFGTAPAITDGSSFFTLSEESIFSDVRPSDLVAFCFGNSYQADHWYDLIDDVT